MPATIAELYDRYILKTVNRSITLVRGEGSRVFDDKGTPFLDFATGIAVSCLGHGHPALVEAYASQSAKLVHCSNLYYNENAGPVAERIVRLIGPGKLFFTNSGAEANEGLIKLARLHGRERGAFEVVCAANSFHGRTMATLSATGQEKIRSGFDPLLPGMVHVPYNDLEAVRAAIGPKTAAVLVEGIQGEGGIFPASPEYLLGLRKLTREKNLLLLMDAVQCGWFRTGKFQSYERILEDSDLDGAAGFRPDALSMAKSMGGGFPIGAFWVCDRYAPLFAVGSHNTTYGGSPLGAAVVGAILDVIEKENLAANVRARGEELLGGLRMLTQKYPAAVAVRGHGALVGLELNVEPGVAQPHFTGAGLLLAAAGARTLRYLPAYIATRADVDEALARTEQALQSLQGAKA